MEYRLTRLVHDSTAFVPISQEEYGAITAQDPFFIVATCKKDGDKQ